MNRYNDYYLKANFSCFALFATRQYCGIMCWKHDNNFLSSSCPEPRRRRREFFECPKMSLASGTWSWPSSYYSPTSSTISSSGGGKAPDNTGVPCSSSRRREDEPRSASACTVALRFRRALRASVLYGTEARKAQKIIGDTVLQNCMQHSIRLKWLEIISTLSAKCKCASNCKFCQTLSGKLCVECSSITM